MWSADEALSATHAYPGHAQAGIAQGEPAPIAVQDAGMWLGPTRPSALPGNENDGAVAVSAANLPAVANILAPVVAAGASGANRM